MNRETVSAPSNIALIKYMGKADAVSNLPTNPSLSYSLKHLRSFVSIEKTKQDIDTVNSFTGEIQVELSEKAVKRYLKAFAKLKSVFALEDNYVIRTGNNFPSDSGLASSASSFAALCLASFKLACEEKSKKEALSALALSEDSNEAGLMEALSELSRKFSGSSCRSFFKDWSVWQNTGAKAIDISFKDLKYIAVVVSQRQKKVSSSVAHLEVLTSDLFTGRPERAKARCDKLLQAFEARDWQQAFEIVWAEFWDMHALFETSKVTFGYMEPGSLKVLRYIKQYWDENKDGPICTMDAGPNVHLLFRADQDKVFTEIKDKLSQSFLLLGD